MKLKWLDRSAFTLPLYFTLATSQKILDSELKRLKFKGHLDGILNGAGATTHFIMNENNDKCAVVCLFDHSHNLKQTYALLVHEAVHIFQEVLKEMREEDPSPEFEAYIIQKISQDLFYEYDRQVKRGKKK